MDNIGRREVLLGGGTLTAGLTLGTQSSGVLGKEFLENIDKNTVETQSERLRERLLRSEDVLSEVELSTPQQIEAYEYNTNKNSTDSKVTDKGVKITDNFYLSSFDGDVLQGEVDGNSYTYHYLEGTEIDEVRLEDVKELLDVTGDGYKDVVLSGNETSDNLGRINDRLADFESIRPFLRVEDQTPFLTETTLEELKNIKNETEESIEEYAEFLNSYEGSPSQISESCSNIMRELESSDTSTHRRLPLIGPLTGRDFSHNHLTVEDRRNIIEGKEEYSDIGLKDTRRRSDILINEASLEVGKALLLKNLLSETIEYAERNQVIYESPEDSDSDEEEESINQSYKDILDEDSQNIVETYFSDAEFELGEIETDEVYIYEDRHSFELRIEDYDVPLRLNRDNGFRPEEADSLAEYGNKAGALFEEIL